MFFEPRSCFVADTESQPSRGQMKYLDPTCSICFGTPTVPAPWGEGTNHGVKASPCVSSFGRSVARLLPHNFGLDIAKMKEVLLPRK